MPHSLTCGTGLGPSSLPPQPNPALHFQASPCCTSVEGQMGADQFSLGPEFRVKFKQFFYWNQNNLISTKSASKSSYCWSSVEILVKNYSASGSHAQVKKSLQCLRSILRLAHFTNWFLSQITQLSLQPWAMGGKPEQEVVIKTWKQWVILKVLAISADWILTEVKQEMGTISRPSVMV